MYAFIVQRYERNDYSSVMLSDRATVLCSEPSPKLARLISAHAYIIHAPPRSIDASAHAMRRADMGYACLTIITSRFTMTRICGSVEGLDIIL